MLIVQSFRTAPVPRWIARCLATVEAWAAREGHGYERVGDDLFDLVPPDVARALGGQLLPMTDVARLVLLRDRLAAGSESVLWLDADVLVFAPDVVSLDVAGELAVCREPWVTGAAEGALRVVPFVCNAALLARRPGRALHALYDATLQRVRDGDRVTTRSLGPDLLTVMDRASPLAVIPGISLFSPHVVRDLAVGGGPAVDVLWEALDTPVGAANLCASSGVDDDTMDTAVDALLSRGAFGGDQPKT